jgi:predicted dehydrogenase
MGPLRVGLAGAGPWAGMVHGPLWAAGPETTLTGVWSRTAASARHLAAELKVPAFDSYEELVEESDALAIAVAPMAQPALAVTAAAAGRAVLLEKPLALDVSGAERIVEAVAAAGVGSGLMLPYRYVAGVRSFLAAAEGWPALAGRACFLSGAFLGGPFAASPWRQDLGCLLDVGPHILDLVEAALGPVTAVHSTGDPQRSVLVALEHEAGAVSQVSVSCRAAIDPSRTEVELWGAEPPGWLAVDARAGLGPESFASLRTAFVSAARRGGPAMLDGRPLGAERGLELQRLVHRAERAVGP